MTQSKDVLITGAGGGLGAATTHRLVESGWRVFAADLRPPAASLGVVPVEMDVTDDGSVETALDEVRRSTDGLGGIVTFAGILSVGALLDLPAEKLRRILDINLLGAHRVVREGFDLVRAGHGRVVLISSETGVQSGAPFNGPYGMSKHAVEAYADSLRRELMFLGVPVVKLQPGPFKTDMVDSILRRYETAAADSEHFPSLLRALLWRLPAEQAKAHDPALLAEVVERALTERRWKPSYLVLPDRGRMMLDRLPVRIADRLLRVTLSAMAKRRSG